MTRNLDCDRLATTLRAKILDTQQCTVLVSRLAGTEQEKDLTKPPNCGGVGRIRHFRRQANDKWVPDPLPNDPATKALGMESQALTRAQVFQSSGCNLRCWYCFVPSNLLAGKDANGERLTAADLIDRFLAEEERPDVIDLSGGEVSLTPEWVVWMMRELQRRSLHTKTYLWSDDNLTNDFFWRFLAESEKELVITYRNYGKVACFKGFSPGSFSFNTGAAPELFERQFDLMERWASTGVDLYSYCTLTTPTDQDIRDGIPRFVDRLQAISDNLPLRTVPLLVSEFGPVTARLNADRTMALRNQWLALEAWRRELSARFASAQLAANIADVCL
ncbi:4Fe-4S cluster-binding domain-containing protein [Myxococcota bacterium]